MLREKETYRPRSRASLLIGAFRWAWRKSKTPAGADSKTPDPHEPYGKSAVFGIGVIHGLGAETPSQLLLFLLAANLGGIAHGFLGLAMFLAGLLVMNTLMTASAVGVFGMSAAKPRLLRLVIGFTAAYSLIVGTIFLFGSAAFLPPLGS
jgi:high-affinity nickel-transport protein